MTVKKVTILHTIETGGPGGAETVLLNLASGLDPERFRSLALLTEDRWLRKKLEEKGVETRITPQERSYDLGYVRAMARLIREEHVNLIHSHLPGQNFYSCLAAWWTRRKAIVTYHGPVELSGAHTLRQAIKLRWVRHAAAAVVVVCDYVAKMLSGLGFPSDKVVRIYNGIDAGPSAGARGGFRKELCLLNGAPLVGMVANIRRTKGYDYFVRAARQVTEVVPDAHFVAVGEVDPGLGGGLMNLVRELGLENNFHWLGFRDDVPAILRDLDLFVLSSTSEGFPLAALEAMAASKPVVLTRSGGTEEIVENGRTGVLVEPGDSRELASRISELLRNREQASELGAAARAKILKDFSLTAMIARYESLYDRLLGPS